MRKICKMTHDMSVPAYGGSLDLFRYTALQLDIGRDFSY